MDHLEDITVEQLQAALDAVEGKKPTQRLLAAIAYKNGVTQTELAEWYGVERRTIYSWLTRLDAASLEQAVYDSHRSGRPRKLSGEQQEILERTVREPPTDVGYEELAWTPALLQNWIQETYDVEYSIPSCRRFLKESGLRYRRSPAETTEDASSEPGERTVGDGAWVLR